MAITILGRPYFVSGMRNKMPYTISVDPSWDTYDDYYIRLKVYKETSYRSGTQELLFQVSAYPNPENQVVVDVHKSIQSLLIPDAPIGYPNQPRVCQKMNSRYQLEAQEWRNGVMVGSQLHSWQHVLRAGFRSQLGPYLWEWVDGHNFLTKQPRTKKVSDIQPERLYYCLSQNLLSPNLVVRCEVTFQNGLSAQADPGWTISAETGDVVEIPAGYQALNLSAAGQVTAWKLWLEEQTSGLPVSEYMSYELDCYCSPLDRYFLFENTLGGYDVLKTRGNAKRSLLLSAVTAQRPDDASSFSEYRQGYHTAASYRNETEQATGFLSVDEKAWMVDLLMSEDAYRLEYQSSISSRGAGNMEALPILIQKNNVAFQDDAELLERQSFNYVDANIQQGA
jgi:hypothetical protein